MPAPDRLEMTIDAIEQLKKHCPMYGEFHDELDKAASHGLVQNRYMSVNCEYTISGDRIIKLMGCADFLPPQWNPRLNFPRKVYIHSGTWDDIDEPSPESDYVSRLHKVAHHIVEKYGRYLSDIKFGPESVSPSRFGTHYVMQYTWTYILP